MSEKIVLEIKAQMCLTSEDEAQIINSLKTSKHKIVLLINFGEKSLRFKRFINGENKYSYIKLYIFLHFLEN